MRNLNDLAWVTTKDGGEALILSNGESDDPKRDVKIGSAEHLEPYEIAWLITSGDWIAGELINCDDLHDMLSLARKALAVNLTEEAGRGWTPTMIRHNTSPTAVRLPDLLDGISLAVDMMYTMRNDLTTNSYYDFSCR